MNMRVRRSLEKHNLYCYVDYRAVPFVLSRIIRGIRLSSVDPAARDRREPYTNTYTRYNISPLLQCITCGFAYNNIYELLKRY